MRDSPLAVFFIFLRLGLTSFGGPVAHLGYFRTEFVERRKWLAEAAYADLVALCQLLPGPASSQVGIALGLTRAGYAGGFAAWLGFTAPSALALILFGLFVTHSDAALAGGWLHGLKVVAVAVVAQALWGMARTLTPDARRAVIALAAACMATALPNAFGQIGVIVAGGVAGVLFLKAAPLSLEKLPASNISRRAGVVAIGLCLALLAALPLLAEVSRHYSMELFDVFFRTGALVFGGGHVVLPLLQAEVVPRGWVSNELFMAGYGAAQAVPGPLFTFAAYLGSVSSRTPNGWLGGMLAVVAIFLPSFLLVCGALPFLETLRQHAGARRALTGVNAAVVGLLLAAFYNPVWTSAILTPADFCLAALGFFLLLVWKWPSWLVVVLTALAAVLI
ncbi:chromate efflux transporter [Collimonas sp.]|jgi:chromate transporter|uniref:chromate efflux transporter n=1 Tax=Collimonas sp. TaxID=1963772 RepID=UPI002CB5EDAF|nr:chromate efflux transporter [Collimonas sp.]HWX02757.1 chromate efflux transporter [Collimonas sp.]